MSQIQVPESIPRLPSSGTYVASVTNVWRSEEFFPDFDRYLSHRQDWRRAADRAAMVIGMASFVVLTAILLGKH